MNIKTIIALPLICTLAACGGGGGTTPTPTVTNLSSIASDDQLQALNLITGGVTLAGTTKTDSSSNWNPALQGDYVVILNNGDIVGVAASAIPTSVDFAGTEKATAYFLNGDTEVGYQLNGGDVDGSINSGVLTATISNFSSQTAETYNGTDDTPFQDDVITATINSTVSGATDCGAANLFCGGVITVTVNGGNAASINSSETETMIGVYGTDGAYELGGRINADDGNTNDSFSSSFIATQQ